MNKKKLFLFLIIVCLAACMLASCKDEEKPDVGSPSHTHQLVLTAEKAADCLAAGNIAYWYCDGCKKYFSDAEGKTEVALDKTAVAALGHSFGEWTAVTEATFEHDGKENRECSRCHEKEERTVVAGNHEITLDYDAAHGSVNADLEAAKAGKTVMLTVAPAVGYRLTAGSLKCNGAALSGLTFVMPDKDAVITAAFEQIAYNVTASADNGALIPSASAAHYGDAVTVSVTPDVSYRLKAGTLSVNGEPISGTSFAMPAEDAVITCEFERLYVVSVGTVAGGTVVPSVTETTAGSTVSLVVTPQTDYRLKADTLKYNGNTITGNAFIMPSADVTVSAEFEVKHTVTGVTGTNVTITPSVASAWQGDIVSLTIDVADGYQIKAGTLKVNGQAIAGTSFVMTGENAVITVEIEKATSKNLQMNYIGTGYEVTGIGTCTDEDIIIPDTYNDGSHGEMAVKQLHASAFKDCTAIKSVKLTDNIEIIGEKAFQGCTSLSDIVLSENLSIINDFAFDGCPIKTLNITENVSAIWTRALVNLSALETITVAENNVYFRVTDNVLIDIANKTALGGGKGNGTVRSAAFIPSDGSVTKVGKYAFYGSGVVSLNFPSAIKDIGDYACSYTNITYATLSGAETIGSYAFSHCDKIERIGVSTSLRTGGANAFAYCKSLKQIEGGKETGMKFVADDMVGRYLIEKATKKLVIGTTRGLTKNDGTAADILTGAKILSGAFAGRELTKGNLVIPEGVSEINDGAFDGCTTLTSVVVPKSALIVGAAFTNCPNITSLTVTSGNPRYVSKNNCIIDIDNKRLVNGCKTSIIPADGFVTQIAACAFMGCTGLTEITIPASVTLIYNNVFRDSGLQSLILDSSEIANYRYASDIYSIGTIYVKDTIEVDGAANLAKLYTQVSSDKAGYDKYVKNA